MLQADAAPLSTAPRVLWVQTPHGITLCDSQILVLSLDFLCPFLVFYVFNVTRDSGNIPNAGNVIFKLLLYKGLRLTEKSILYVSSTCLCLVLKYL